MRPGSAPVVAVAIGVLMVTGCSVPRPAKPPSSQAEVVAPPLVVEIIDRGRRPGARGRRLADTAVRNLAGEAGLMDAWAAAVGRGDPEGVLVGEGPAAPEGVLAMTVRSRVRLARSRDAGPPEGPARGPVVLAAAAIREGRFVGVSSLLGDRAPDGGVALALLDLQEVVSPDDGWSWEAGVLVAGRDAVAVDRVALRILDSARRATGAPGLETLETTGDPRLASAARILGGVADLATIRWRKALALD